MQILAELSAPCAVGVDDCLKLEQAQLDRSGRLMLSWRERAPSASVGVHAGVLVKGSVMQRARISVDADASFRMLLAAPRKYSALVKESSSWRASLFDASSTGTPVLSDKVGTSLTDELVRNFAMWLSANSFSEDSELNTLGRGVTTATVDLGGGVQAKVAPLPSVAGLSAPPVRERYLAAASFTSPTFFWLGTTALGQGFRVLLKGDGSGDYGSTPLLGSLRASTSDGPDCRSGSSGFPSVFGTPWSPTDAASMGWLESNDAGTACNLLIDGAAFNTTGTHVRKGVMNSYWVVWEQQTANDKSGPTEVVASVRDYGTRAWGPVAKLSTLPVSRLLAQASGAGSSPWATITWQECGSVAADAVCTTYLAKTQTAQAALLTQVELTASSGAPLMAINYSGTAVAVWAEPRAACKADATKQCAQIRARWF